ncbi:muskelin [Bemisia tabaci]|uniref:muskelin n=1 Tax=Bemisia tabaci TaxID=7038 RepID=UPI0008F99FF4|nr:PREDICTED: muskelin [Bemisia tabaci]
MAAATAEIPLTKKLDYTIHSYSSYSPTYVPENIREDKSNDQTSRWSSDSNNPPQFLTLKLVSTSIVQSITFGKYEKAHVCNLKKFKIYGGLKEDNMIELLSSGLKNDSNPETFELRNKVSGNYFPCRFIKILPLQSWGPSFNYSVWFVELSGIDDRTQVQQSMDWFHTYQEQELIRLCMKHFRKMNYTRALEALYSETKVKLEHPALSNLYDILVNQGDYDSAQTFIADAATKGLFKRYISEQEYRAIWRPMQCAGGRRPGMRGGHQMCIDVVSETIYLIGGYDGNHDLSDLWSYHIPSNQWTLISSDTESDGGPSARSCHKICFDPERRQIFTLGRYLDIQFRTPENLKSDFYVYDIESNSWTLISDDTASVGGPQLIFDHQMCMDVQKSVIYVFGGKILTLTNSGSDERLGNDMPSVNEPVFSGLYSYHVPMNIWTCINTTGSQLRCRMGHSMLFHPCSRKLYVFAGQRNKEYLNDFFSYDVDTGSIEQFSETTRKDASGLSAGGFTQRATIDPDLDEIYVLSGLSKDKEKRDDSVQNSLWVYYIRQKQWSCIYRNENQGEQYWNRMQYVEPCPRFAHQLVYDHVNKVHYLFGGNPGRTCLPKLRLDDFWQLQLSRPTTEQIVQRCSLLIRKHKFQDLALKDTYSALNFLQTSLSEIIDHSDPQQANEFRLMAALLFQTPKDAPGRKTDCGHHQRVQLFEQITEFFASDMTQPKKNLIDLIPL